MAGWSITPLHLDDLDGFVQCQFLSFGAFGGNPLHDVVYPTQQAAIEAHRKAISDGSNLQAGNEIIYLKVVDNSSGNTVGGIKFCIYAGEYIRTSSPYAAGITDVESQASYDDQYRTYIINEFLGKLIDLLFVHPEHVRRGIGRELVARTCLMADERHLGAIVEASPVGKRTYELCGYESMETVTIDPKHWTGKPEQLYYWMERVPLR